MYASRRRTSPYPLGPLLAALATLAGCASPPPLPPELQYAAPPSSAGTASVRGSQESSALLDDLTAYVLAVDGKRVMGGRPGWREPLTLAAGKRRLGVVFQRGASSAQAEVWLDAQPGVAYEVRYATDVQLFGANSYCDFWIVDRANGRQVTETRRGFVTPGRTPGTYYAPPVAPAK